MGAMRLLDILVGILGLLLTSPFILLALVLTYIDTGRPLVNCSFRLGQHGIPFTFYKIRTMHQNAPPIPYAKPVDDKRVTPVGWFLRKLSLDELLQFWHVVKGDMAIFGPRPWLVRELPLLGRYADVILSRKPGIVNAYVAFGRSDLTIDQRLHLDAKFARRMNWKQCCHAVVRLFCRLLDQKGAR